MTTEKLPKDDEVTQDVTDQKAEDAVDEVDEPDAD